MRLTSRFSLALAIAVGSTPALAIVVPTDAAHAFQKKDKKGKKDAQEGPNYELGKEYRAQIITVQELLNGTDHAATAQALSVLEPLTTNDDEKYLTGQMYLNLAAKTNDNGYKKKGLEYALGSTRVSQEDRGFYTSILGEMALVDNKDFAKADEYLTKALGMGYETAPLLFQLSEVKYSRAINASGGKTITPENAPLAQEGLQYAARALALPDPKNQLDKNRIYSRAIDIASVMNSPDAVVWARNYAKFAPGPDSWNTAISLLRRQAKYDDQTNLDLMRLMRRTDSLKDAGDYAEYVTNADARSLPGEVAAVLEEGMAKGVVNTSDVFFKEALSTAKNTISEDRNGLSGAERSAQSSATGRVALATGDAYLAYDEPAKAASLYQLALDKGQIDRDRALTRLGIAQADLGNYVDARAAFSQVQGNRKPLADMWLLWVDQNNPQDVTGKDKAIKMPAV